MESHIATPQEYDKVEQAYWDLYSEELLCSPNFTAPDRAQIESGRFIPIICTEGEEVLGVMCIKAVDNGVYYPSMKRDYVAVLRSMCACAQENFDSLVATTDNGLIHALAVEGGLPFDYVDGVIVWSK